LGFDGVDRGRALVPAPGGGEVAGQVKRGAEESSEFAQLLCGFERGEGANGPIRKFREDWAQGEKRL